MGLGFCLGKSCVVSTFRLKHTNQNIHLKRLQKVAVHEFGHNLGLPHCKDKKCVMTDAVESIKTIDNVQLALCNKCQRELWFKKKPCNLQGFFLFNQNLNNQDLSKLAQLPRILHNSHIL